MAVDGTPELLILNRTQFGCHVGTYCFSKFAAKHLRITYVGFDTGRPKLHLDGVKVEYLAYGGRRVRRYVRLLVAFARAVRKCQGAIFIEYFPGCTVLRCFGAGAQMILDIRTGSIRRNAYARWCENRIMQWESRRFRNISVVSQSLAERLRLPSARTHVLPLGAERMPAKAKRCDRLDLLYVGTLDGRRIEDTVVGFERFLQDNGTAIAMTYTIVGDGHNGELDRLRRMVQVKGLDDVVRLPGYVHRTRLESTFERCNVGVSYVPICDMYDCQPVTKTFEYLFAGMPVIATATSENTKIVNGSNGVLIRDTPDGFYGGLKEVYARRHEFDSDEVRHCCPDAAWDRIVNLNFIPYVQKVCQF